MGLPSVVIVGRPNVGKSTLFNAILRSRRAIVGDEPGITRDRIHGVAEHRGRRFDLVDTGGIIPDDPDLIPSEILRQARVALERAAHIIFLVDGRAEITAPDRDLARMLIRLGKPVALAVNKIDSARREDLVHGFYELGIGHVFAISAEHQLGIGDLLDHVTEGFPAGNSAKSDERPRAIKVAIIGRPNVGKSTLLNALVGAERAIVSPVAGTTRDAVDEAVTVGGQEYVFVDTAGIRRKGKTKLMAEKLSVVMARRHIRLAHVVLLVVDATEGVVGSDATIAGYAHEGGRGIVVCVNKWDVTKQPNPGEFSRSVRDAMKFVDYARIAFVSAKTGSGVKRLYQLIGEAFEGASKRVPTGELNRFAATIRMEPDVRVRYITQASVRPPTFVLFTDKKQPLHFSAERHLINRLRKQFDYQGTPIVIKTRTAGRDKGRQ